MKSMQGNESTLFKKNQGVWDLSRCYKRGRQALPAFLGSRFGTDNWIIMKADTMGFVVLHPLPSTCTKDIKL